MLGLSVQVLLVCCCLSLCHGIDQHLVCKSVTDIFSVNENTTPNRDGHRRGPPGKRGAMGPRGPAGPPGPTGVLNNGLIDSRIQEQLEPVISRLNKLEKFMAELNATKEENMNRVDNPTPDGPCDVRYSSSCFWAINHDSADISLAVAQSICNDNGAKVADIHGKQHYDQLIKYLRTAIPSLASRICFRLGLTYDHKTKQALRSNGAPSYTSWYTSRPSSNSGETTIYVWVNRDPFAPNQGMYNYLPSYGCQGVVCER